MAKRQTSIKGIQPKPPPTGSRMVEALFWVPRCTSPSTCTSWQSISIAAPFHKTQHLAPVNSLIQSLNQQLLVSLTAKAQKLCNAKRSRSLALCRWCNKKGWSTCGSTHPSHHPSNHHYPTPPTTMKFMKQIYARGPSVPLSPLNLGGLFCLSESGVTNICGWSLFLLLFGHPIFGPLC